MSVKKLATIVSVIISLSLLMASCGILNPTGVPSEEYINTSVAETVNAQNPATEQPVVTETPAPPVDLPTDVPAPTEEPARSPLAVAFVSPDHDAYFWNETLAAPVQLTNSGDIREAIISPDGSQIVLLRSSDWTAYSLEVINSDGSLFSSSDQDLALVKLVHGACVLSRNDHKAR